MQVAGAPDRTLEQRLDALRRANHIRSWRAELKRDLYAGRRLLGPLLAEPPEELGSMQVFELLLALPKVGRVRAMKTLKAVAVSPSRTVAGLSGRQRRELLLRLGFVPA